MNEAFGDQPLAADPLRDRARSEYVVPARALTGLPFLPNTADSVDVPVLQACQAPDPIRYWTSNVLPVSVEVFAHRTRNAGPLGPPVIVTGTFTKPFIPEDGLPLE